MDKVPRLFVERVCLLLDGDVLGRSWQISSFWSEVGMAFFEKIHTLLVFVDKEAEDIYAVARPTFSEDNPYSVALDSVDLKFITNFHVSDNKHYDYYVEYEIEDILKKITLDDLQKLIRFIRPTTEGRHPVKYNCFAKNYLYLTSFTGIGGKILSMYMPVDTVTLYRKDEDVIAIREEEELKNLELFFENAGPLYDVSCSIQNLKPRTIEAMIDKFVPLEGGSFSLQQSLSNKQLERLVLKCVQSDKEVSVYLYPEGATKSSVIYAVAQPTFSAQIVPLHSVELKFITNFSITYESMPGTTSSYKEITVDKLQRLMHFMNPKKKRRHPVQYDSKSTNYLRLSVTTPNRIYRELLTMRLPIESLEMPTIFELMDEVEAFLEITWSLYRFYCACTSRYFEQSTVDALIDTFIPTDGGSFSLTQPLSKDQLERLVVKCEMSDRKVRIRVSPQPKFWMPFFDNYFSQKRVKEVLGQKVLVASRQGGELVVHVMHLHSSITPDIVFILVCFQHMLPLLFDMK
uniref:Cilia- and flagella-associated protein 61 n=1 Tax=Steinernema glaseri TaxID=37863 RepID=A0A1I7Y145_9BILA